MVKHAIRTHQLCFDTGMKIFTPVSTLRALLNSLLFHMGELYRLYIGHTAPTLVIAEGKDSTGFGAPRSQDLELPAPRIWVSALCLEGAKQRTSHLRLWSLCLLHLQSVK